MVPTAGTLRFAGPLLCDGVERCYWVHAEWSFVLYIFLRLFIYLSLLSEFFLIFDKILDGI